MGPTFFSSFYFCLSFSFLLIFVSHFYLSHFYLALSQPFLYSLSPSARHLYLPLQWNPGQSIKPSRSLSQQFLFFFFFFLVCDLMVYSEVVVWVCDLVLDGYGLWWADGGGYLFNGFLRWTGGGWWWVGMSFMVWFWVWVCDLILGLFLLVILVAGGWGCEWWCLAVGVVLVMNFWPWMVMGHRFGWVN